MAEQQLVSGTKTKSKTEKKEFIVKCIFMIHVRRIGWIRTSIGGFLQYVSILEFIFIHLTTIVVLYQWMLAPFFRIKKFRIRDYIRMDRGKIKNMVAFDRLNCDFCAYANGTAMLWNEQVDAIAASSLGKGKILLKLVSALYALMLIVFLFFTFFFSKLLYLIIALFLGLHWTDNGEVWRKLKETEYAGNHNPVLRLILRSTKLYARSLADNLEQLESQWCPIKHVERINASEHHANFFDADHIQDMYTALETKGTVSPKIPRY